MYYWDLVLETRHRPASPLTTGGTALHDDDLQRRGGGNIRGSPFPVETGPPK